MISVEEKEVNTFARDVSVTKKVGRPPCTTELQPISHQNIQSYQIPLQPNQRKAYELKPNLKLIPKENRTPLT